VQNKLLTRRSILETMGKISQASLLYSVFSPIMNCHADVLGKGAPPSASHSYSVHFGMVVMPQNCIGCGDCVKACRETNNLSAGNNRLTVYQRSQDGKASYLPVMCNQCDHPPCVDVCPTRATYVNKDNGLVLINSRLCIGCRACILACPYQARYYNESKQAADGCDFCFATHLQQHKTIPACVEACRYNVFSFGNLDDKTTAVVQNLTKGNVQRLRPDKGTRPNVFYTAL